jgi:bifunctional UDP-N-acetylglucosamine pyrophosphorylase/glucosamine-1-phosphate N-acetyltransferase
MVILTAELPEERPYGRVIRNADGTVEKIVEYKDATDAEKEVREKGIRLAIPPSKW